MRQQPLLIILLCSSIGKGFLENLLKHQNILYATQQYLYEEITVGLCIHWFKQNTVKK